MRKNKIFFLLFFVFGVIIFFTPIFGKLYEIIIGRKISNWFIGPSHPEYFEGFFLSASFFSSFTAFLFAKEKIFYSLLLFVFFLLFIDILLGAWEDLIINSGAVFLAWLLAKGIKTFYRKP